MAILIVKENARKKFLMEFFVVKSNIVLIYFAVLGPHRSLNFQAILLKQNLCFVKRSILDAWKGSQYASDNIKKILKMNEKKKTQPQNAQHRELASLLLRVPKHKLLSLCTVFL